MATSFTDPITGIETPIAGALQNAALPQITPVEGRPKIEFPKVGKPSQEAIEGAEAGARAKGAEIQGTIDEGEPSTGLLRAFEVGTKDISKGLELFHKETGFSGLDRVGDLITSGGAGRRAITKIYLGMLNTQIEKASTQKQKEADRSTIGEAFDAGLISDDPTSVIGGPSPDQIRTPTQADLQGGQIPGAPPSFEELLNRDVNLGIIQKQLVDQHTAAQGQKSGALEAFQLEQRKEQQAVQDMVILGQITDTPRGHALGRQLYGEGFKKGTAPGSSEGVQETMKAEFAEQAQAAGLNIAEQFTKIIDMRTSTEQKIAQTVQTEQSTEEQVALNKSLIAQREAQTALYRAKILELPKSSRKAALQQQLDIAQARIALEQSAKNLTFAKGAAIMAITLMEQTDMSPKEKGEMFTATAELFNIQVEPESGLDLGKPDLEFKGGPTLPPQVGIPSTKTQAPKKTQTDKEKRAEIKALEKSLGITR